MGIRFFCPNGHKLNVKEHLAGMRAICPECDTRFLVPMVSGGPVEAITEVSPPSEVPSKVSSPLPSEPSAATGTIQPTEVAVSLDELPPQETGVVENHRRLVRMRRQRARMIAMVLTGLICLMAAVLVVILTK